MIIEYEIEKAIRPAIRTAIEAAALIHGGLDAVRIIGSWLPPEENTPRGDSNDAEGIRVFLRAAHNSSPGWLTGTGLDARRTVQLDVMLVTQPESDATREKALALYEAVRTVFDTTGKFTLPTGLTFGGLLITGGGSIDIEQFGQVVSFQVQMKVSI